MTSSTKGRRESGRNAFRPVKSVTEHSETPRGSYSASIRRAPPGDRFRAQGECNTYGHCADNQGARSVVEIGLAARVARAVRGSVARPPIVHGSSVGLLLTGP